MHLRLEFPTPTQRVLPTYSAVQEAIFINGQRHSYFNQPMKPLVELPRPFEGSFLDCCVLLWNANTNIMYKTRNYLI